MVARLGVGTAVAVAVSLAFAAPSTPAPIALSGGADPDRTLRVSATNPRWFVDPSGRAVYLTGSHVWWNLAGPPAWPGTCSRAGGDAFSFDDYLDLLARNGHNFIRLWRIELTRWEECGRDAVVPLHPWPRVGPEAALDGGPRFDLSRFDEAYFDRLRARVAAAQARGMYVSVMLFDGWSLQYGALPWAWAGHPFNGRNNVNGIDADVDGDGRGTELNALASPAVLAVQEAYVRKVVDTVNGFDNVLYEIANESGSYSTEWQYHMIRFVKDYEAGLPKRHPVGMTFQHGGGSNATLLASPADWISPFGPEYLEYPPGRALGKVIISDTDHHCGVCTPPGFAWKSFVRGLNPILMDPLDPDHAFTALRRELGQTRHYALRIDLAQARPQTQVASTRYALVVPGRQYLVLQPGSGPFTVNLRAARRRFAVEWLEIASGRTTPRGHVHGGRVIRFRPPFGGPAVLFLRGAPPR
jgi:hypothetical protein